MLPGGLCIPEGVVSELLGGVIGVSWSAPDVPGLSMLPGVGLGLVPPGVVSPSVLGAPGTLGFNCEPGSAGALAGGFAGSVDIPGRSGLAEGGASGLALLAVQRELSGKR